MAKKRKKRAAKPGKTDLVYGLGKSGLSVARYMQRQGSVPGFIDSRDEPPGLDELKEILPAAGVALGESPKVRFDKISRLIVSPGIADSDALLQAARAANVDVVSDIQLFVDVVDKPFVAITGSNGKSTVATLLALMCKAGGKQALAGANLGEPALDLLAQDEPEIYILELSSFQLQRTHTLPATVAVLLNISPDHLDWHDDEHEYRDAKYRVYAECEAAVWNRGDDDAVRHIPEDVQRLSFGLDVPPEGHYGIVTDEGRKFLARGEQLLLSTDDIALVGAHNQANALAALAAGELIGLEIAAMLQVLHEFPGLPHRMQFVANIDGVDYINDSKATNVGAATASVESVDGLVVLLAGGQGKGGDFKVLARSVHGFLRAAVLFGEDGPMIADALDGLVPVRRSDDLRAAVATARSLAERGDTVLLAPACASFDQYPNYQERGEDFCRIVQGMPA